jgi:allantoicase
MSEPQPDFTALPDLAAARLGGVVLEANDEFFAPKENLLKAEEPTFDPHAYTDRGKEMDGWETRRRREPGHDHCTIRLGVPGIVRGVVVDTSFFRGNFPERCSLEATGADDLEDAVWWELLPESPLQGDARNGFWVDPAHRVTHLRFHIYPDGGVARLRVYGEPRPDLRTAVAGGLTDLACILAGGSILDASDRFFSSPHNLIAPGQPQGMHDGWETKRRRGPGHDWVAVRLAAQAELERIEVDTAFFKGNYPDTCSLEVRIAGDERSWTPALPPQKLGPDRQHVFELEPGTVASYVRLNIHPDGGVARLRVHGRVTDAGWRAWGVRWLDALAPEAFEREIVACCASAAWARSMRERRPFGSFDAVLDASDAAWAELGPDDRLEAFAAHPRIGERKGSAWSKQEQAGTKGADKEVLRALEKANRRYELEEAAEQQRQIARLRVEKLVRPPE